MKKSMEKEIICKCGHPKEDHSISNLMKTELYDPKTNTTTKILNSENNFVCRCKECGCEKFEIK
jgi:hypothetical protein